MDPYFLPIIPEFLAKYRSSVEIVPAVTILPTVIADPDDHVLAWVIAANADLIVLGDKHLLDLKRHQDIETVNAGEAFR